MVILPDDSFSDDANSMSFSPGDDLFVVAENISRLVVTDADSTPR